MKVVYTAGVFDLLHQGHLNLLRQSKALGDVLVVGVVSDAGAEAYKRKPYQNEATRLDIIRSLSIVDCALLQPTTDPTPVLELLLPHVMTHGDDWDRLRLGQETLERLGIEWALVPYTPDVSTSATIEAIDRRKAADALEWIPAGSIHPDLG